MSANTTAQHWVINNLNGNPVALNEGIIAGWAVVNGDHFATYQSSTGVGAYSNKADGYERRAPGTAGMRDGVRYQFYETRDGHVLFMASEREFWKNLCDGVGRPDLFERHPGSRYGDHARGNRELQGELREIFLATANLRIGPAEIGRAGQ